MRVDPPSAPPARLTASASASASASAPPRGRTDLPPTCDAGLHASGEPRHDISRLGLICGASEGLVRHLDSIEGALAAGGASVEVPVTLEAGRCYLLLAAAETTIGDLDVELRSERDIALASDDEESSLVVLPRASTVCPGQRVEARIIFRAGLGRGRFAAEVWSRPATDRDSSTPSPP